MRGVALSLLLSWGAPSPAGMPLHEPEVSYHTTDDGRLVAIRRADSPAFVFGAGDPRMGRAPKRFRSKAEDFYRYDATIVEAATTYGLDPVFIKAILEAESSYSPRVVSHAGAQGVVQLMPSTAKRLGVKNPFDPFEAIWGAAAHLRRTADAFQTQNMVVLAGAYNAGDPAMRKALLRAKAEGRTDLLNLVPRNKETPGYVRRVLWIWDRIHRGR